MNTGAPGAAKHSTQAVAFQLPVAAPARVLACGAWLKNTACLLDGNTVHWSAQHGDLGTVQSREALQASVAELLQRASGPLDAVAHDLHPDFYSTELALQLAQRLGVPAIAVQHHHAHIAQVVVETGLGTEAVGWALDGVGMGTDQTAWGGELLSVHGAHFERRAHLPLLALPGGDAAAREPWRMAASVLHWLGRSHEADQWLGQHRVAGLSAGRAGSVPAASVRGVMAMLQRGLNCPSTSSTGRWFDAVAALLGLCWWQDVEAEAAVALERVATEWLAEHPAPAVDASLVVAGLHLETLLQQVLDIAASQRADAAGEAAALFHIALVDALSRAAVALATERGVPTVVLGGGCFFNRLLREAMVGHIEKAGLRVVWAQGMNVGDAGLALGQAWVAARQVAESRGLVVVPQVESKARSDVCV